MGTYKQDLLSFVVAYAKQTEQDNENGNGNGYDIDDEVMEYLQCQQYYYNNNMVRYYITLRYVSLFFVLYFVWYVGRGIYMSVSYLYFVMNYITHNVYMYIYVFSFTWNLDAEKVQARGSKSIHTLTHTVQRSLLPVTI